MSPRINSPARDQFVSVGRVELPAPVVIFAGEEMDESSNLWDILKFHFQSLLVKIRVYFDREDIQWNPKRVTAVLLALLVLNLTFLSSLLILTNRATRIIDQQATLNRLWVEICQRHERRGPGTECLDLMKDQIESISAPVLSHSGSAKMKRVEQLVKEQIESLSFPAAIDSEILEINMNIVEEAHLDAVPVGYSLVPYNIKIGLLLHLMTWMEGRNQLFCGRIRSTGMYMKYIFSRILQQVDQDMNEILTNLQEIREEHHVVFNETKELKVLALRQMDQTSRFLEFQQTTLVIFILINVLATGFFLARKGKSWRFLESGPEKAGLVHIDTTLTR